MPGNDAVAPGRSKRTIVWWISSIVLHVGAVFLIVWCTPLHAWLFAPNVDVALQEVNRETLDRAVATLLKLYEERLRSADKTLHFMLEEMRRLRGKQFADFKRKDTIMLVNVTPAEEPLQALTEPALKKMGVLALYDFAVAEEKRIVREYEVIRAFQLAWLQKMPLDKTLSATKLATPARAELNRRAIERGYGGEIVSALTGSFDALQRELNTAHKEAKSMVAACERLLDLAKAIAGEGGGADMLHWDLAAGATATTEGEIFTEGKPYVGALLLPKEWFSSAGNLISDVATIKGTKIMGTHKEGKWLSVDTWWVVGPFTHPGRSRPELLDRTYPPEAGLDLDAVYVGKDGRKLRWKYRMTQYTRIEPFAEDNETYAIWYFYTEIYSDKDEARWVAFGSDDYSIAWLAAPGEESGRVIWRSPKQPQPWLAFGPGCFRKVEFKKGYNALLLKLENAGGTTGFSVIICLDPNIAM